LNFFISLKVSTAISSSAVNVGNIHRLSFVHFCGVLRKAASLFVYWFFPGEHPPLFYAFHCKDSGATYKRFFDVRCSGSANYEVVLFAGKDKNTGKPMLESGGVMNY